MATNNRDSSAASATSNWWLRLALLLLWASVLASALAVVYTTHYARQLTDRLAKAETEASELQVQRGQYLLERSAWGAYNRVETLAADQLQMTLPEADQIIVVER